MERRMRRVRFESFKAPVGQALHGLWQLVVTAPEIRRGPAFHRSVHLPFSKSLSAFLASLSSRPSATSSSNCRSHCLASKFANHFRSAARSSLGSLRIAVLISLIVLMLYSPIIPSVVGHRQRRGSAVLAPFQG